MGPHPDEVKLIAPAGSLIIFNGCTWHGAFPKVTEGLRLSLHAFYVQPYYLPMHDYRRQVTPEMYARSRDPDYLRMLVREDDPFLQLSSAA